MMMTSSMVISSVLRMEGVGLVVVIGAPLSSRDMYRRGGRIAAISCGTHDARDNGLVQPARRCPRKHHGRLVRPAGHDADAPGLQGADPGSHHGCGLHHQE